MLQAFQSLRDQLTSKRQVKVDQTSASKPGPSQAAVNLDLPPPSQPRAASNLEQMEVDYGPALSPHLSADHHMTSDRPSIPVEEPTKKASVRPKTHSHSHKRHVVDPRSAPMGKVPLPILKEFEHQARQNIFTLNFTAAFAKTSSSCNATLEKCQHSLKSTFKRVKSQIQMGANPEKAAKHGYEQACE